MLSFDCDPWRFVTLQWYHGGPSDSNTRWRPPLRAVVCTACYRLFAAVYVICWLVADLLSNMDPCYWTFLTHWGQIVMVLYFVSAFFIVLMEMIKRIMCKQSTERYASMRWYHVITLVLFIIYVTSAGIITTSYWVGVTFDRISPDKSNGILNIHVHVINSTLALIELLLGNLRIRMLHFFFSMAFGMVYLVFTVVLYWTEDIAAVYDVLDWKNKPWLASWYAMGILLIAVPVFHFVAWGIMEMRHLLYKNCAKFKKCGAKQTISPEVENNSEVANESYCYVNNAAGNISEYRSNSVIFSYDVTNAMTRNKNYETYITSAFQT